MIIPAKHSTYETLASGGAPGSVFTGTSIEVVKGHDFDPTRPRGMGRLFRGERSFRPGAHSPRVPSRVTVDMAAPSTVGTTLVSGMREAIERKNAARGVAGSRQPYALAKPKQVHADRVSLAGTPARHVYETAVARTGVPVIYSKVVAPAGYAPPGLGRFDPIPARAYATLGMIVAGATPVGCLPGTPGCYAGDSVGLRRSWGETQNEGEFENTTPPSWLSPLPAYNSPHAPIEEAPIPLPINHPGSRHVVDERGGRSYGPQPNYPRYTSPFGYAGSGSRPAAEPVPVSGHDDSFRRRDAQRRGSTMAAIFVGVAIAAAVAGRR